MEDQKLNRCRTVQWKNGIFCYEDGIFIQKADFDIRCGRKSIHFQLPWNNHSVLGSLSSHFFMTKDLENLMFQYLLPGEVYRDDLDTVRIASNSLECNYNSSIQVSSDSPQSQDLVYHPFLEFFIANNCTSKKDQIHMIRKIFKPLFFLTSKEEEKCQYHIGIIFPGAGRQKFIHLLDFFVDQLSVAQLSNSKLLRKTVKNLVQFRVNDENLVIIAGSEQSKLLSDSSYSDAKYFIWGTFDSIYFNACKKEVRKYNSKHSEKKLDFYEVVLRDLPPSTNNIIESITLDSFSYCNWITNICFNPAYDI